MNVQVAKTTRYLDEKKLWRRVLPHARKALGTRNPRLLEARLVYKELYFQTVLSLASRFPFKPKRRGYVIFFDSVTGRSGLTPRVPVSETAQVLSQDQCRRVYDLGSFTEQLPGLLEKYILRRYLLKRPELRCETLSQIWLAYFHCTCVSPEREISLLFNAETGGFDL